MAQALLEYDSLSKQREGTTGSQKHRVGTNAAPQLPSHISTSLTALKSTPTPETPARLQQRRVLATLVTAVTIEPMSRLDFMLRLCTQLQVCSNVQGQKKAAKRSRENFPTWDWTTPKWLRNGRQDISRMILVL